MKNITAIVIVALLVLAAGVIAQTSSQPQSEKKTWEITQLDMEDYVGNSPILRQGRVDYWNEKGAAQYEEAKKKLLSGGWEPYAASLRGEERSTFSDSTIIFFRRLK